MISGKEELSKYIFTSKYARHLPEEQRRETYSEAIRRMMCMHRARYPQELEILDQVEDALHQKKILGSQRALQYGGVPVERHNARAYNCCFSYCDRPDFFREYFYLLLCGCGVGFSVQKKHVDRLPAPLGFNLDLFATYEVEDSIEGWADALGILVDAFFSGKPLPIFDFSGVRPEGSRLSSGVGKAPGPEPLRTALNRIQAMLITNTEQSTGPSKLRPIEAYDIAMHASDAVLSGGVRRAASIALFSLDDDEMRAAKTGDWFRTNPQRARSNNSAILVRDGVTFEDFRALVENAREWGEPGFYFVDDEDHGTNPCVEIGLYPVDELTGKTGWQFCNLSVVNVAACEDAEDFIEMTRLAAALGTFQAGYTSFPYLGEVSERITRREALLGVSQTGMCERPDIAFDETTLQRAAHSARRTNEVLAKRIGINRAARVTCIKPEGTSSCLLGTSSGIHPHHARRYLRRVQANHTEAPALFFEGANPRAVEASKHGASGTDKVLTFPVSVPDGSMLAGDISALALLERVKVVKRAWVDFGNNRELATSEGLSHNVSNTIRVKPDEWGRVARFIYDNRADFSGVSLLAASGDLDYTQAPFVEVLSAQQILEDFGEGSYFVGGLIEDAVKAYGDLWDACNALLYPSEDTDSAWIRRAARFADRYFSGDTKQMTRCLKSVHNLKLWEDLNREMVALDYTSLCERDDNTSPQSLIACAGGSCDI